MSSASGGVPPRPDPAAPSGPDPSMEDILASIRRILNEDDVNAAPAPEAMHDDSTTVRKDDVLVLDTSMIVEEPVAAQSSAQPTAQPASALPSPARPAPEGEPQPAPQPTPTVLVAPEAAASAASAVSALVQALVAERAAPVHRTGPTIEDVVREELRPMLKAWLDQHLPPLVERLVRTEIERVVGRAAP
ncbi:MAG: DUF2497 domain-containing protein [Acetobacteraceae bacterium]|nr:DUF2497 domain-containing protein [Acetobacteraceae bacterium]